MKYAEYYDGKLKPLRLNYQQNDDEVKIDSNEAKVTCYDPIVDANDVDEDKNDNDDEYKSIQYIPNKKYFKNPHHTDSIKYVKLVANNTDDSTIYCQWLFPYQHGHRKHVHIIYKNDVQILTKNRWLNDNLMHFQMDYIYSSWPAQFKDRVYILNVYFYPMLKNTAFDNEGRVQHLVQQCKTIQCIFDVDYIIIPTCYKTNHWRLIIVCNASTIWQNAVWDTSMNKKAPASILILDSLSVRYTQDKKAVIDLIIKWMNAMYRNYVEKPSFIQSNHEYKEDIFSEQSIPPVCVSVPQQSNSDDCGCFLLKSLCKFGEQQGFSSPANLNLKNWYPSQEGVKFRQEVLKIIQTLRQEQNNIETNIQIVSTEQIQLSEKVKYILNNESTVIAEIMTIKDRSNTVNITYPIDTYIIQRFKKDDVPMTQIQVDLFCVFPVNEYKTKKIHKHKQKLSHVTLNTDIVNNVKKKIESDLQNGTTNYLSLVQHLNSNSHWESIFFFLKQCIAKWSTTHGAAYQQYFKTLTPIAMLYDSDVFINAKVCDGKSILDVICERRMKSLFHEVISQYEYIDKAIEYIMSGAYWKCNDDFLSHVFHKAFTYCGSKTISSALQNKMLLKHIFDKKPMPQTQSVIYKNSDNWTHLKMLQRFINKLQRDEINEEKINENITEEPVNDIIDEKVIENNNDTYCDDLTMDNVPEFDNYIKDPPIENVNHNLPQTLIQCNVKQILSIVKHHDFGDKSINSEKERLIQYLKQNNINGKAILESNRKTFSTKVVKFYDNKIRAAAAQLWSYLAKYQRPFDDDHSRQIANGLGIEYKKVNDLNAKVQWKEYRSSYTNLWKALERLVFKSTSKDACEDLLKDMNARQLQDIHRALGCPGSPRGRPADMKPVISNKIVQIHNNLRESGNIYNLRDDDDKEEEIPTVRGQNKYNWLLRKYEIVNNETQKNEIICDDVNESNWDYVKCNNKQNTLLYDCDHYMSKIIDITKNNKQIGLTFWNPALNRCFLELAIHCPDEHAPPGWVQLNKRWLFKFDGRSYPNGHKLKGTTKQNAMNKLEKMKYKIEHFKYDNFADSNEENEV